MSVFFIYQTANIKRHISWCLKPVSYILFYQRLRWLVYTFVLHTSFTNPTSKMDNNNLILDEEKLSLVEFK